MVLQVREFVSGVIFNQYMFIHRFFLSVIYQIQTNQEELMKNDPL